ncbi:V-set domain-containing T-cell activation inhibitor 1 [Carlito syrichta]|uniref:V-set domain-containing T-cell activation inhibitor 1 n=1 Tax=Carlito syrichta TaxID=1868482 RepID=A0A3Q0DYS4_CARSF|nr:V-set domain-containing T-cell activation inhibitor 1 [Carlito syrichta]
MVTATTVTGGKDKINRNVPPNCSELPGPRSYPPCSRPEPQGRPWTVTLSLEAGVGERPAARQHPGFHDAHQERTAGASQAGMGRSVGVRRRATLWLPLSNSWAEEGEGRSNCPFLSLSFRSIISIIFILAGAIALIIGFGISGRHPITVTALTSAGNLGEDGILSCTFEPDIRLSDIVIQWLKEGVVGLVHEFKEGRDDLSDQEETFRGRTAVFADQVIVGNASLRLKNVQLTDAGIYKCYIITSKGKGSANLEYKTGAFSMPEVNVDHNASSETLRCEAPRWFPQPTVVWASQVDGGANFSEVSNTSFELNSENVTMKVVSVLYNVTINNTYSCMIENDIAKATGDIKVTDSEIKRRSHLQLLNSKASPCVSSFSAIIWVLLPLSSYLVLK